MTISALPDMPSRSDAPPVFVAKGDAALAALVVMITELNAAISAVNMTKWISGTTYAIGDVTWSPSDYQAYRRKTAGAGTTDPSADSTNWQRTEFSSSSAQAQSATAFTTAGTAPAFTLTPTPVLAAYTANQRFRVKFNAVGTTGSNTININALGVKNLKQYNPAGVKVPAVVVANQLADVEYDGTDCVILDPLPAGDLSAIAGFTYANNGTDAANDIDIAAGACMSATNDHLMQGAALTKRSDAAWAVGTAAGMLDTGAVADADYYLWAIARSDTGVVDYLSSLSATAPTMPASYTYKRLIGWFKRTAGAIVAFHTYEAPGGALEFAWDAPALDIDLNNTLTTSRRTDALRVPQAFSTVADISVMVSDATTLFVAQICCPDQTDAAPSSSAAPLANIKTDIVGVGAVRQLRVRTSSTGTIAARSTLATVDNYRVSTQGFEWSRR